MREELGRVGETGKNLGWCLRGGALGDGGRRFGSPDALRRRIVNEDLVEDRRGRVGLPGGGELMTLLIAIVAI